MINELDKRTGENRKKILHVPSFLCLCVSSWKKVVLLFAVVFGSSFFATACNSGNSNQSTAASAGRQPQTLLVNQAAQNGNQNTIKIGYVKWALLPIVRERGTLEKDLASQNIQIGWVGPFPNFAPLLETLNARSTDIASGGSIPVITGLTGGADICLLAYRPPDVKSQTIIVPKDSPVRQVTDLIGKKVAVNKGGGGELLLLQALKQAKISENKVERVYLGPTDALPALLQGHVDAWSIWDPGLSTAEEQYGARRILQNNPAPSYGVYVVRRPVLAKHPQAVKAILDTLKKEGDWATSNPEQSATILEKAMGLSPAVIKRVVANRPPEKVLPLEPKVIADIQEVADWMVEQKVIPKRIDVASAVCPATN